MCHSSRGRGRGLERGCGWSRGHGRDRLRGPRRGGRLSATRARHRRFRRRRWRRRGGWGRGRRASGREAHHGPIGAQGARPRSRSGHARKCHGWPTRRCRGWRRQTRNQRRSADWRCSWRRRSRRRWPGSWPSRRSAGPGCGPRLRSLDGEFAVAVVVVGSASLDCDHAFNSERRGRRGRSRRHTRHRNGRGLRHRGRRRTHRGRQGGADAIEQRLAVERFDQVTVGANPPGTRLVQRVLAGHQDVHRYGAKSGISSESRTQIVAVARSQHRVCDHQVWTRCLGRGQSLVR